MSFHLDASVIGSPGTILPFFLGGAFCGFIYDVLCVICIAFCGIDSSRKLRFFDSCLHLARKRVIIKKRTDTTVRKPRRHTIVVILSDFLTAVIFSVLFQILLFRYNSGAFRWYYLPAALCGFFVWHKSCGKMIRFLFEEIWVLLRGTTVWLYNHTLFYFFNAQYRLFRILTLRIRDRSLAYFGQIRNQYRGFITKQLCKKIEVSAKYGFGKYPGQIGKQHEVIQRKTENQKRARRNHRQTEG